MNGAGNEKSQGGKDGIRTLKRALDVLQCFDLDNKRLTLTEIARKISLAKSTTLRFINALEQEGYLAKNEDNTYTLGYRIYYLGTVAKDSIELRRIALPIMHNLQEKFNETVNLYLFENDKTVCFEQIESSHALKRTVRIGDKFPIWSGASGRTILAFLDTTEIDRILKEVKPLTDFTITDLADIKSDLQNIREVKYSFSHDEREIGVACVAAPIFDAYRRILGSISLSGPTLRFTKDFVEEIKPCVFEAGKEISFSLGCKVY